MNIEQKEEKIKFYFLILGQESASKLFLVLNMKDTSKLSIA